MMDCIRIIQEAIDYMEIHLLEKISYEDVAKHLFISNHHFHRLFSMITGITANEYIRNRRLSMAGQELILSDKKIIDLAFKYGYETPESFTKAFTRFHGVTPNVAKRSGTRLKSFSRLIIKLNIEGGTKMDYKIVERTKFQLLAKVQCFKNDSVLEETNTDIPDFWHQCGRDGTFDVLNKHAKSHDIYGVCAPVSKEDTDFHYGIGMVYEGGEIPEGFQIWDVTPTLWAVFKCIGSDTVCIDTTWDRIFKEFLPSSAYNMLDEADFELYPEVHHDDCFCEIWIPVEKK